MFTQYQNYLTCFYDQFVLFDTTQCNVIFLILIVESSQNQLGVSYTPSLQPVYSRSTAGIQSGMDSDLLQRIK